MSDRPRPAPRRPWRRAVRVGVVVVAVALVGEVGHQFLERQALAHHLFHVLFVGGAAAAFVAFVVVDIRRHGRPSFTWRTRGGSA